MVTTQNKEWAEWMNSYKHFGMDMSNTNREGIQFDIMGTNYKLSNVQAAIGLGQMAVVDELLAKRLELAKNYDQLLKGSEDKIQLPRIISNSTHSYQTYCVFVENRNEVMQAMREKGIEVQIGTYSLHMHKAFQNEELVHIDGDMTNSIWCCHHALALPLYHELTAENQQIVIEELKNCVK
jgi:dTDP-4-amino-4,6-dideoxygalactose transaminase